MSHCLVGSELGAGATALQVLIGLSVLVCVHLLVRNSLRRIQSKHGIRWLRHGTTARVCAGFGIATTVVIAIDGVRRGTALGGAVAALAFGTLTLPLFLLTFFWRVGYDLEGLYCVSPWRRNRFIPWSELTGVSFSSPRRQWILATRSQGIIRINEMIPGCGQLLSELEKRGIPIGSLKRPNKF